MKTRTIVARLCAVIAAILTLTGASLKAVVANLDDLNYWGTGPNRAAFVVDWNDGKANEVLAWGFRWGATAPNVADMMIGLASLDPNLFFRIDSSTGFGATVFGIGYDSQNNLTFSVTGAVDTTGAATTPVFVAGVSDMNITNGVTDSPFSSSGTAPLNAGDHYSEAWNTPDRYWALFLSGDDPFAFSSSATPSLTYPNWAEAGLGVSGVSLNDGAWYALSFSDPGYISVAPGAAVAAVPEPGALGLVLLGISTSLLLFRRLGCAKSS